MAEKLQNILKNKEMTVYKAVLAGGKKYSTSKFEIPDDFTFVTKTFDDAKQWLDLLSEETDLEPQGISEIETNNIYWWDDGGKIVKVSEFNKTSLWDGTLNLTEALINTKESKTIKEHKVKFDRNAYSGERIS